MSGWDDYPVHGRCVVFAQRSSSVVRMDELMDVLTAEISKDLTFSFSEEVPTRRILTTMDALATAGRPHGGANRPFGFEADKVTVRDGEAAIIRVLAARFIAGESLRSLAVWLEAEGIRTVTGRAWKTPTLASMLSSGRIAGLREHHGEVVSRAVWTPIITETDRDLILARFNRRPAKRPRQYYLLRGMMRCGKCGTALYSSARKSSRRYVCMSGPDHGGCGKLSVVAEAIERVVVSEYRQRTCTSAWDDLQPECRRELLRLVLEHVVVDGGAPGRNFDPKRVRCVWRM